MSIVGSTGTYGGASSLTALAPGAEHARALRILLRQGPMTRLELSLIMDTPEDLLQDIICDSAEQGRMTMEGRYIRAGGPGCARCPSCARYGKAKEVEQ